MSQAWLVILVLAVIGVCRASERVVLDTQHDWQLLQKGAASVPVIRECGYAILANFKTNGTVKLLSSVQAFSLDRWNAIHAFLYLEDIAVTQGTFNMLLRRHLLCTEALNENSHATMLQHEAVIFERTRHFEKLHLAESIIRDSLSALIDEQRMSHAYLAILKCFLKAIPTLDSLYRPSIAAMRSAVRAEKDDSLLARGIMQKYPDKVPIMLTCSTRGCAERSGSHEHDPAILILVPKHESLGAFSDRSLGLLPCSCLEGMQKPTMFIQNRSNRLWQHLEAHGETPLSELHRLNAYTDGFVHLALSQ